MTLPSDLQFSQAELQFSQGSLQDFVECPRRFYLRHVLGLAWPAIESEPVQEQERHMRQGQAFHRLVHQHLLGLDPELLRRQAEASADPALGGDLARWWRDYEAYPPANIPARRYPEIVLSAPVAAGGAGESRMPARLIAKYDLIAIEPGRRAVIVDWKTSRHRPRKSAWSPVCRRKSTAICSSALAITSTETRQSPPSRWRWCIGSRKHHRGRSSLPTTLPNSRRMQRT